MTVRKNNETMLTVWSDEYLTGIDAIDEQHRHLFNVVGELAEGARKGLNREAQEKALEELINYACYHFSTEEEWMKKHSFPDGEYQAHAREHAGFVDAVKKLRTRMYGGDDIFMDLLDFARRWLADHVAKTDAKYAKFARELKQGSTD